MKTFKVNDKKYYVKVLLNNSTSNYNRFAHCYKVGEKLPVLGHTCKETTTMEELIKHFKISIAGYLREQGQSIKGDRKQFFGKWFVWSGSSWGLDEICKNVISPKNVENSGYPIHSYSM